MEKRIVTIDEMQNTPPLVSVIIRTYNRQAYLQEAIRSCLNQSYKALEILVIDDGSTDGTRAALTSLVEEGSIRYVRQENQGRSYAANWGLALAQGKYIQFLDSDDLLLPTKIERQVRQLRKAAARSVAVCDYRYFRDHDTQELWGGREQPQNPVDLTAFHSLYRFDVCLHSILFPVVAFEECGDFDPELPAAEDWEFWVRLVLNGYQPLFDDKPLALYRRHPNNITSQASAFAQAKVMALQRIKERLRGRNWQPYSQQEVREAEEVSRYNLALHLLRENRNQAAWKHLFKAWRLSSRRRQPKTLLLFTSMIVKGPKAIEWAQKANRRLWNYRAALRRVFLGQRRNSE